MSGNPPRGGRGRGRPPKSAAAGADVVATTPNKKAAGTGRGRGRPPGSTKKPSATAVKTAEAAVAAGVEKGKKVARGGPGRARVSYDAPDAEEENYDDGDGEDVDDEVSGFGQ